MKQPALNNKGQFVIEMVLLMIVSVGLFVAGTKKLRDGKVMSKLIGDSWPAIAGMIESGVWAEPEKARADHPNQRDRSLTVDPNGE